MDHTQLIARCQEGDHLAVEQLVEEFQPMLFRLALTILDDGSAEVEAEAEDATQEVLLSALRKLDNFRGESSLSTWLYAITVNLCRNRLRSRRRRQFMQKRWQQLTETFWPANGDPGHQPETNLIQQQAEDALFDKVLSLGEKHRLPIILRYYHDFSIDEIAQILNVPIGTIHSRLNTARQRLRDTLSEDL